MIQYMYKFYSYLVYFKTCVIDITHATHLLLSSLAYYISHTTIPKGLVTNYGEGGGGYKMGGGGT